MARGDTARGAFVADELRKLQFAAQNRMLRLTEVPLSYRDMKDLCAYCEQFVMFKNVEDVYGQRIFGNLLEFQGMKIPIGDDVPDL